MHSIFDVPFPCLSLRLWVLLIELNCVRVHVDPAAGTGGGSLP